ncbi:MAG: deoxyribonuclease IV [Solobacterium sp.]|nr:deoxyribonuclease IV [Solobacterium sp.]
MIIGCHVKMAAPDFLEGSVKEALGYDANALMLYTGAPQNTKRRALEDMHINEAKELMRQSGIPMERMIIHAPYLINPANAIKPEVFELAGEFLYSEVMRTHAISASYIVLHPGSFTSADLQTGISTVIRCLNGLPELPEGIVICLETMAGKGSEVGRTFEELAEILEGLDHPEHYGICLDTCHVNDAGYDVNDFDGVLDEFDRILSLNRLHVIHLNDSKNIRSARKDRHANIGLGTIGFDALYRIASNPRTAHIAKILETPYIAGEPPYKTEIAMLRKGVYEENWQEHLTVSE